jgi:hypothetical protein
MARNDATPSRRMHDLRNGESKPPPPARVPRTARLLALAHKFQGMLDRGEVESMADLARLGRVSRARITQIMDLLLLAPEIQEELLFGVGDKPVGVLLLIVQRPTWLDQRAAWCSSGSPTRTMPRAAAHRSESPLRDVLPIPPRRSP